MNLFIVLFLSIVSILFLLVGTLIVFSTKNNNKVMSFSVSLGFVVLLLLGFIHLIPDAFSFYNETLNNTKSIIFLIVFGFLGFIVLLVLDLFTGHHNEDKNHYEHISLITCIFLFIHNLIEGITLYSSVLLNYETALILTLGIGLHNIPLGFTLSSTFNKNHSKVKTIFYIIFIGFAYLLGSFLAYSFSKFFANNLVLGSALMFTFGMILYIACFEFLPLIRESKEKKITVLGIIIGIITMFITLFL